VVAEVISAGFAYPMLAEKLKGKLSDCRFVGVEPKSCASMGKGKYFYDYGDTGKQTPMLKMKSLGCEFVAPPLHAGGLRYHGIAPSLAFLHQKGLIESKSFDQVTIFKAAQVFAESEGVVVAPESAHAVASAIAEAKRCKKERKEETIVFNLSGQGLLDLKGYEDFLDGRLKEKVTN
jgi:tryptophan synthase beta chain